MQFHIGVIRVLTTDDEAILNAHGKILEKYFPNFKVESKCIPNQFEGIHSEESKSVAIPKIIELAKEFKDKDAIIVSCADDPGVAELKKIYSKPIIGAGTAVAMLSSAQGQKIGILGITDEIPEPYRNNLGSRAINLGVPDKVNCTLDLMTEEGFESCIRKGEELKKVGADLIALACTGCSTVGLASKLEKYLGIPILDPVICEGIIAYFELIRRL